MPIAKNDDESTFRTFYSTPGFQEWHATVESIRFLSDDVAIVEQIASTTFESGVTHDNATVLTVRTSEGWKIRVCAYSARSSPEHKTA